MGGRSCDFSNSLRDSVVSRTKNQAVLKEYQFSLLKAGGVEEVGD
jgi:hypothetical protein